MKLTPEQYANLIHKYPNLKPVYQGSGPRSELQKQQDDCERPIDNGPEKTEANAEDDPRFRITVTLLISDNVSRDCDGAYSTLQDCIMRAIGGLLGMDSRALRKCAASFKRARRRKHKN